MVFELANPEDFEAVNRIARQVSRHHAQWDKDLDPEAESYPMDFFLECVAEKDYSIYVARQEGTVVGYVRFYIWRTNSLVSARKKILSLEDIGVEQSLRRRGIGQDMMKALCSYAREAGCTELRLYVDAPNKSAIAYYEKCGFQVRNLGMSMAL